MLVLVMIGAAWWGIATLIDAAHRHHSSALAFLWHGFITWLS